ncbi:uncharacterized protein TNIN_326051 [Trichonephila inaurata madagascariensis]|uniref:Uncharacterized protein n=1 Tax=Trichonephila inaurata madagascariensis TaxID=2747483 RepID=A0A8X6M850_9ARAC|nr:uncharacterized protein TNIN_326051 [Trichonephila inaurata madagascariensis]
MTYSSWRPQLKCRQECPKFGGEILRRCQEKSNHKAEICKQRVISHFFLNPWSPRSPYLTPCDFWLWGYLKSLLYLGGVAPLNDLKNSITLHVRSPTTDQLRSASVRSAVTTVHRLEILKVNEGGHTWSTFPFIVMDTIDNCCCCAIPS